MSADIDVLREYYSEISMCSAFQGISPSGMYLLVSNYVSRVIDMLHVLVSDEIKVQNVEDLGYLIWKTRSSTLERLMTGLLYSFRRHDNPQPRGSLAKLGRIQQCLQHVLCISSDFIFTHHLVPIPKPQPASFPIPQLSPSMDRDSVLSLVTQQVSNAVHLMDLIDDCLVLIGEYDLDKLKMDDLAKFHDLVSRVNTLLEKRALAEGAVHEEEA
ncbi:PREDICTED: uncharacterized protein LOC104787932 [Camelina sativa]|uniref:Uncharacterized protein LOC104787932 n=1 Tax=Camelina sativa TaxID=90675 RepID=A0ABM0Z8F9_CAMSA|nr:PREDICTED: uncharacterized protein LOC104787932 [Camelina sativa]